MNRVYEKNGYIYIKIEDPNYEYPNWVTSDYPNSDAYFLLNETTSKLFIREYIGMITARTLDINKYLLEDIGKFKQNPETKPEFELITKYKGITLQEHQVTALSYMLMHNRYALFYGTGTGKTMIALFYLLITKPKRVLIVTPKKVVAQFKREIEDKLYHLYSVSTDKVLPNTILVTNPESLHKIQYSWIDCMIIDESHKAKNFMSDINRNLRDIAKSCTNIYLFTGTPQDTYFSEIFPQLAILDNRVYPSKSKWNYRYYKLDDYHNPKRMKQNFRGELMSMIKAYSYAVKTDDVLVLPPMEYKIIDVTHPGDIYNKLLKERLVRIKQDDSIYTAIADLPTTLRIKLQEICSGFLLDVSGEDIDYHTPTHKDKLLLKCRKNKQNELYSFLSERQIQAIIFTCFDAEIELVSELLDKMGYKYAVINGSTSIEKVNEIKMKLKSKEIDYIVANAKCTSEGLDLYFIHHIIFYSLPESYITYHQCCSRIHRIGQTEDSYVWHLICKDTVEVDKLKALKHKESYTGKLFQSYLRKE